MSISSNCVVPIVGIIAISGLPAIAGDTKPAVSLFLAKASAERKNQEIVFLCEVMLDNATGKELTVRSNFFSAFDGLELVVTSLDGTVLAHQGYTWHQSPLPGLGETSPSSRETPKTRWFSL